MHKFSSDFTHFITLLEKTQGYIFNKPISIDKYHIVPYTLVNKAKITL